MKKIKFVSPLFLLTVFLFGFVKAEACSCLMMSTCEAYARAKIVFTGKIVKSASSEGSRKHQVQIEENFLGMENISLVDVYTDDASSCAFEMTEGEDYLIYAWKDDESGAIWTGMCSHTAQVKDSAEDLEYLRSVKSRGNKGGTIKGKVTDSQSPRDEPKKPEQINKVYIEKSDGQKFEAGIEPNGEYELTGLSEGKYKISVNPPKGYITDSEASPYSDDEDINPKFIDVAGRGCTIRNFEVKVNGVIGGKVFDADGIPVAERRVNLFRLSDPNKSKNEISEQTAVPETTTVSSDTEDDKAAAKEEIEEPKAEEFEEEYSVYTNEKGGFDFKGLPPGRYLLGFETENFLNIDPKEDQYLPTYFPNSKKKADAVVIELKTAEVLADKNIQLFPKLKKRIVTGQVLLKNNRPVSKIESRIYARREGLEDTEWMGELEVDAKGNFKLEAFEETEYLIQIRHYTGKNVDGIAEGFSNKCFIIPKKGKLKPAKIILEEGTANCTESEFENQ